MKYFLSLLLIPLLFLGCSEGNGFDSDISRACHSSMFSPAPDSPCPAEAFIGIGDRGASCLCESETGEKFLLTIGPNSAPSEDPDTLDIGDMTFRVMQEDCSTISLFENTPSADAVGELRYFASGNLIGSLEFVLFLNANSSSEEVICPACWSGPVQPDCDIEEELN